MGKKTTKNIIFYTPTILLLVIHSIDKQAVVITNCKCFKIMDKLLNEIKFL